MTSLRLASRGVKIVIIIILAFALVALTIIFVSGGIKRLTAPFRGETDKIERTEGDGAFRQATYQDFFDLCQAVQNNEGRIQSLKQELETTTNEQRITQINASLTAVRNARIESINDYNSKAAQEHKSAFKDATLPERLDHATEETQCTA